MRCSDLESISDFKKHSNKTSIFFSNHKLNLSFRTVEECRLTKMAQIIISIPVNRTMLKR